MKTNKWPKIVEPLSPETQDKYLNWEAYWLAHYNDKYHFVEEFNKTFLIKFAKHFKKRARLLEVGPGLSTQVRSIFSDTDYYCFERRQDFCQKLRSQISPAHVFEGDIQEVTGMPGRFFDIIVALHILEHLPNLPAALREIRRILVPQGTLLVVIPCVGSPLYDLGGRFSSGRAFRRMFGEGYELLKRHEHMNSAQEIVQEIQREFFFAQVAFYPFRTRILGVRLNFLAGFCCLPKKPISD